MTRFIPPPIRISLSPSFPMVFKRTITITMAKSGEYQIWAGDPGFHTIPIHPQQHQRTHCRSSCDRDPERRKQLLAGRADTGGMTCRIPLTWGKFALYIGLRIEGTLERLQGQLVTFNPDGSLQPITTQVTHPELMSTFSRQPSFGLCTARGAQASASCVYGRGFARPDYQDLPPLADI